MAAVNIKDFRSKMNSVLDKLTTKLPELGLSHAITSKTLIQKRIQTTGKNSKGGQLGEYSESYKKTRQRQPGRLQVAFVDLTFSARMWANIGAQQETMNGDKITVKIGTSNSEDEKKLVYNTIRYDEVLSISKEEQELIGNSLVSEVSEFLQKEFQQ